MTAGAGVILDSLYQLYSSPAPYAWTVFALLTLFSGTFAIKVPSIPARISVSETFVFTAVLLFGTAPGTLIVALDGLIVSLSKKNRQVDRVLFNAAEPAVSIWVASHLLFFLSGTGPLAHTPSEIAPLVLPLLVFAVAYFLMNSWLTAIAVWLETGVSAARVWRQHFLWLSLNYFGGASVAILIAARDTRTFDYSALSLIVPLLIISYLTFKTALQRVEDARAHVTQLNKLYLSTIETFAMWIDAKDQVTHGHIRRVQTCAVELATKIGLKDEKLIKAVEAAALLHDMGKLAIPEHILNKPGRLTPGEFEKMKSHASVGAEILSSIDFPYPVVPIVRHHHENWDGSGYPDGVAGTDIPIGARILSVVDCYDALTSDRPYRPRLSDDEAISILLERRGTMYDPLVVDAFMQVRNSLFQNQTAAEPQANENVLTAAVRGPEAALRVREIGRHQDGVLMLYELARSVAGHAGVRDTAELVVRHLRELVPASLYVIFLYDANTDELCVAHAAGVGADLVSSGRIRPGVGVSGWVAATHRCMANADARLEFSNLNATLADGLSRAHSVPLLSDDALLGVITLFTSNGTALTDDKLHTLELLSPHLSRALEKAVDFDRRQADRLRDKVTGLPRYSSAIQLVSGGRSASGSNPLVAVFLDVDQLKRINREHGKQTGDAVLQHVAEMVRSNLRATDLLLRCEGDEFVALLTETDLAQAESIAARLVHTVSPSTVLLDDGRNVSVRLTSGYAIAPVDGNTVEELVDVARKRALDPGNTQQATAIH